MGVGRDFADPHRAECDPPFAQASSVSTRERPYNQILEFVRRHGSGIAQVSPLGKGSNLSSAQLFTHSLVSVDKSFNPLIMPLGFGERPGWRKRERA